MEKKTAITFLGVWDTVGALGIPFSFWGMLDNQDEFLFHDVFPSRSVKCARHALSIDENRSDFDAVLWDESKEIDLKQVWFPGVHGDVGGGYKEKGLSDTAFDWIIREAKSQGLKIETHLLSSLKPNPTGKKNNEFKGLCKVRGKQLREIPPGSLIHKSVKTRYEELKEGYRSPAFRKFFKSVDQDWAKVSIES